MLHTLFHWFWSALALLIVARITPGIEIAGFGKGFGTSLIAAIVIGLVNATLGLVLKIIFFPLTLVTFGLVLIVINALMLKVAAALMPGFRIHGFLPAIIAAVLLGIINAWLRFSVFTF
jgi:putative membrane protein